ncbi:methyl-accepting chemotaxis protein [Pseudomonas seleniipraecipitans]|uniref:Methyl-accepting chemotaxis protein n=1 Tax=Phytopseudomonas seleniipraecipitans TaxID=640205 RepID=A0ABY5J8G4_9GAMM|nr:methyl-accepting chemotaxis protein [Pseudomonas seleniipraecipitans]UUD62770.1 methyl-accepting chemotaxis protein [Pseudomonas seleniipraecipitans]
MNIRQKMIACGAVSIIVTLLVGGIGLWSQALLGSALIATEVNANALRHHMDGDMMHDALRADVLAAFLTPPGDKAAAAQVREDLHEHSERFRQAMAENSQLPLAADIRQAIDQLGPVLEAYIQSAERIIDQALVDPAAARASMTEFSRSFAELETRNEAISAQIEASVAQTRTDSQTMVRQAAWWQWGSLGLGCLLILWITRRLLQTVLQPLAKIIHAAKAMAKGNLRTTISVDSNDEAGQLQQALADMQAGLRRMIETIRSESEELRKASHSLSETSSEVARGASEQADGATSMAAAMEQMIGNIAQIAEHTRSARDISEQSEQLTTSGGQVILGVVDGMNGIADAVNQSSQTITALGQSSEQINSIILVIRSIAEQTNLLALNAAIEAARAGEAGRGFAVVADEVRSLAARTAQSTQEITVMIQRISESTIVAVKSMDAGVSRVSDGVTMAQQASASISEIRRGVQRSAQMVDEIAHTITEQSKASNEVAERVEMISEVAQRNNLAMQDLASMLAQMDNSAQAMEASVRRFEL